MTRLASILALSLALAACASQPAAEPATDTSASAGAEQAPLVPPGEAQVGDRSTCPVSGEEFVVAESSPRVEHEGRTYFFCCPHCAERFRADPARFLERAPEGS